MNDEPMSDAKSDRSAKRVKVDDACIGQFDDNFDVIIVHSPCADGTLAVFAFKHLTHRDELPPIVRAEPDMPLAKLNGKYRGGRALILDMFPSDSVKSVSDYFDSVLVIDHHASNQERFYKFLRDAPPETSNIAIICDTERSACQLTWDHFSKESHPRPYIIDLMGDRDRYVFVSEEAKLISNYIFSKNLISLDGFDGIEALAKLEAMDSFLQAARAEAAARASIIDTYLGESTERWLTTKSSVFKVRLMRAPTFDMISELGHTACKRFDCDFAVMWTLEPTNKFKCSCRSSVERKDIDLSKICAELGGGGHAQSASFSIPNISVPVVGGPQVWCLEMSDSDSLLAAHPLDARFLHEDPREKVKNKPVARPTLATCLVVQPPSVK